jgi:1-acyl-sn-glycerol-3-phosphate acyltransferase
MLSNKIVKFTQILMYPFWSFIYRDFKPSLNDSLEEVKIYIFTPNHPSRFDPFIIFYSLPFKDLIKILPLRFLVAPEYMEGFFKDYFMKLMGCYKISSNTLEESLKLLKLKNNLCLFIQGKIDKGFDTRPKVGAVYLKKKLNESILLPIKINLLKRRITFMKREEINKFPKDLQKVADRIMERIKNA